MAVCSTSSEADNRELFGFFLVSNAVFFRVSDRRCRVTKFGLIICIHFWNLLFIRLAS